MKTDAWSARRPFGRRSILRAVEKDREAFKAAPRIAEPEQYQLVEQGVHGLFGRRLQDDAKEAAGARKIPFPDCVPRIALERRMHDAQDFRPLCEPWRDAQAGLIVACESHAERAQAPQSEIHVVRADANSQQMH